MISPARKIDKNVLTLIASPRKSQVIIVNMTIPEENENILPGQTTPSKS
jgi:hypothetical protein